MVDKENEILHLNFNQSHDCFSVGTQTGFKIFKTHPVCETHARDLGGGIGYVEMLGRCNILALVGGGKNPRFPSQKVILWDDHQMKSFGEILFRDEVKAVRLKTDRFVVVLETKVFVYNFIDLKLFDHQETSPNPYGLVGLNTDSNETILAHLGKKPGEVVISHYDKKTVVNITAHQSALRCMELAANGKRMATASEKGTIIRVYNTENGELLNELRRGSDYALIYSIAFDSTNTWLACSSDSGTIHIFATGKQDAAQGKNPKSKLAFMKVFSSYFDSQWSFAQYRLNDQKPSKIAFFPDSTTLIIITLDGNYSQINFDPNNGGECLLRHQDKVNPQSELPASVGS